MMGMIKFVLMGVWLCAITLGAAYGVMYWRAEQAAEDREFAAREAKSREGTEQVRTKMISVPLVVDGVVRGYVLAQFTFTLNSYLAKSLPVKPDLYLVDEAFRLLYSGEAVDFKTLKKTEVGALAEKLKQNVNKRFGTDIVQDVFVQELNYLPKEQSRGGTPKS
jgi:hypothetical protein